MLSFLRRALTGLRRKRKAPEETEAAPPAPLEEVEQAERERKRQKREKDRAEGLLLKKKAEGHYDRKKKRYVKKRSPLASLRKSQGLLATTLTTSAKMESRALGELVDLVDDAVEALFPVPEPDSLEEAKKVPPRYVAIDLATAGVLFIQFKDQRIDAVDVATHIASTKLVLRSQLVARIVPFSNVCYADEDNVLATVQPLLSGLEGRSYAIELKRRNNEIFPKDDVIRSVASTVPRPYRVDLKTPDTTILVHVFQSIAGCAVVPNFHRLKEFNLPKLKKARLEAAEEAPADDDDEENVVDDLL
mmetsp:Transcript_14178/g.42881  ORF Transcript_14178/g.42881 Transcript_14178/m.42881 type:complete len:304 (+) Transcript_14178:102-1013(+)